jgi:hypothetical protein
MLSLSQKKDLKIEIECLCSCYWSLILQTFIKGLLMKSPILKNSNSCYTYVKLRVVAPPLEPRYLGLYIVFLTLKMTY